MLKLPDPKTLPTWLPLAVVIGFTTTAFVLIVLNSQGSDESPL